MLEKNVANSFELSENWEHVFLIKKKLHWMEVFIQFAFLMQINYFICSVYYFSNTLTEHFIVKTNFIYLGKHIYIPL